MGQPLPLKKRGHNHGDHLGDRKFYRVVCLFGLVYFIFVRVAEKGKGQFEKRKW